MQKNQKLLFILFIMIYCDCNKSPFGTQSNPLIGTWILHSYRAYGNLRNINDDRNVIGKLNFKNNSTVQISIMDYGKIRSDIPMDYNYKYSRRDDGKIELEFINFPNNINRPFFCLLNGNELMLRYLPDLDCFECAYNFIECIYYK